MSYFTNNQFTSYLVKNEENSLNEEAQAERKRRGNLICKRQPLCPYDGTWRKDTKSAGGGKELCKKCLKDYDEEVKKLQKIIPQKDEHSNQLYSCKNCHKTGIRIRNRGEALQRQKLKLCASCFKSFSKSRDS
jgi:hypothetical protein